MSAILALPMWAAGTVAAVALACCLLAFRRAGYEGPAGFAARIALLLIGAAATWFILGEASSGDLSAERRALDARATELTARAITPGSALACLDGTAGPSVEDACEKALFATPEATAAAVSYVTAQLALLADANEHAQRDASYGTMVNQLRRAAATDRFGIVAHVLAAREGCTAHTCAAFTLLGDSTHVSANLAEGTYEAHVERYAAAWPAASAHPLASTGATGSVTASNNVEPGLPLKPPGPGVFFPSADSIPPVNIMTAEPATAPAAATPPASTHQATTGTGTRAVRPPARKSAPVSKPVDLNSDAARAPAAPAQTVQ